MNHFQAFAYLPVGLVVLLAETAYDRWKYRRIAKVIPWGENGVLIIPPGQTWLQRHRKLKLSDEWVTLGFLDDSERRSA